MVQAPWRVVLLLLFKSVLSFFFLFFWDRSLCVGRGCPRIHRVEQAGPVPTEIHLPLSSGWVLGLKAWGTMPGLFCLWRFSGSSGYHLLGAGRLPWGGLTVLKHEAMYARGWCFGSWRCGTTVYEGVCYSTVMTRSAKVSSGGDTSSSIYQLHRACLYLISFSFWVTLKMWVPILQRVKLSDRWLAKRFVWDHSGAHLFRITHTSKNTLGTSSWESLAPASVMVKWVRPWAWSDLQGSWKLILYSSGHLWANTIVECVREAPSCVYAYVQVKLKKWFMKQWFNFVWHVNGFLFA